MHCGLIAQSRPQIREIAGSGVRTIPGSGAAVRNPAGLTPEVVTVVVGEATLVGDGWTVPLPRYATAVLPAAADGYRIEGSPDAVAAVGSLP